MPYLCALKNAKNDLVTQTRRHFHFNTTALFLLLWMMSASLFSQNRASTFDVSPLTAGLSEVLELQGVWEDEVGSRHVVPCNYFDREHLFLAKTFDIPNLEQLQDTLYLYFEAIAWSSEIFLNGHLLKVTEDPFAEHLLAIHKSLLSPKSNRLTVDMSTKGATYEWYPERFVGIFRQVSLLQVDTVLTFPKFPEIVQTAIHACLVGPWTPEKGYLDDSIIVQATTMGLFSFPFSQPIVFPFRPSNRSMLWLAEKGFQILVSPSKTDSIAPYNYFPFSGEKGHWHIGFWRDANMRPTENYGHYQNLLALGKPPVKPVDRTALLIFLMLPVFSLLAIKMAAPRAYSSMAEYITKTKIYLELIVNNKFLKAEQRWLMNAVRMLLTASAIGLFLYYIELSGNSRMLNFFADQSILGRALSGEQVTLYELFLKTLGWVLSLNLLKYLFLNGIGRIFRAYNLSASIQNLDVFGAFPLNILPLLPATFIFFLDANVGLVVLYIWISLFLFYGIRRVYLVFTGLGRLFPVSASLKILYICTLEILPWLLLI